MGGRLNGTLSEHKTGKKSSSDVRKVVTITLLFKEALLTRGRLPDSRTFEGVPCDSGKQKNQGEEAYKIKGRSDSVGPNGRLKASLEREMSSCSVEVGEGRSHVWKKRDREKESVRPKKKKRKKEGKKRKGGPEQRRPESEVRRRQRA